MTLGNDMFVVSVWHRLGLHISADVAPPPCKCSAGVNPEAEHAMVCEKVAKMTQMRQDNLANALRLVVSACTSQSAGDSCYRALAGKKDMVECQCRGDIMAVLPQLELAAVDVVVAHASAKSYADQLPRQLDARGLRRGLNRPSGRGSRRMCRVIPHSGLCRLRLRRAGYMGNQAVKFVNRLGTSQLGVRASLRVLGSYKVMLLHCVSATLTSGFRLTCVLTVCRRLKIDQIIHKY